MTIASKFAELKAKGEKGLVLFFTAGDQPLEDLPHVVETLVEGGVDAIEVGIPFSDPFGEGPTIQASSQRSLDNGTTPTAVLEAMSKVTVDVPMVVMGYYNPVLAFGLDKFAMRLKASKGCGAIVNDLVPDEAGPWCEACAQVGVETIFLVAPTSTDDRLRQVLDRSTGFIYAVSRTGVTGAENAVPPEVSDLVTRVKKQTEKPVCVGFGISTPDHVRMVTTIADGAVVGSRLVSLLHGKWDGGRGAAAIKAEVAALKAATRG